MQVESLSQGESGQTVVEYILLLVVAVSLVVTIYRSQAFRSVFGEQGSFGDKIKSQTEFSYRHAFSFSGVDRVRPPDVPRSDPDIASHPSYSDGNGTRFFGPRQTYGE